MIYSREMVPFSLHARVKKLLVSDEWSDCCFLISGKKLKAHRLILGISSPVFEAMFYGGLATDSDIIITDIEADVFQLMLNYIYTDNVEIVSTDQAFDLLYASKKYILDHLSDYCIKYIQNNLSIENVISVLTYAHFIQDNQLITSSLKLFCEHANYLLVDSKYNISCVCLKSILECNEINISEKDLIKHIFQWTANYCDHNNIANNLQNRRDLMVENGFLKLLRFNSLSLDEIDELAVDKNNVLIENDIDSIKKHNLEFMYNESPRNLMKIRWYLCLRTKLRSVAPIDVRSEISSQIKANKTVFINSLWIPTKMSSDLDYQNNNEKQYYEHLSISILSESHNTIIRTTDFKNKVEYDSFVNIQLSEPCLIKKDNWYTVKFTWPQNSYLPSKYFIDYRDRYYHHQKVSFEFSDMISSTEGSFLVGLQFSL